MEDTITLDGKKYISSKRAAKMGGYTKDYIGQMCRSGKLKAKLIGRNWYILESSLMSHTNKGISKASSDTNNITYTKEIPSYKVIVDDTPLNPTPTKKNATSIKVTKKYQPKVKTSYKVVSKAIKTKKNLPILRMTVVAILVVTIAATVLTEGRVAYNSDLSDVVANVKVTNLDSLLDYINSIISR